MAMRGSVSRERRLTRLCDSSSNNNNNKDSDYVNTSPRARKRVPVSTVSLSKLRHLAQPRSGATVLTRTTTTTTTTTATTTTADGAHDARASGKYCCCCCRACARRHVCLRALLSSSLPHTQQQHYKVRAHTCCADCYCPGIDRDRIVPSLRAATSYGALHGTDNDNTAQRRRVDRERRSIDACVARIAAEHAARAAATAAAQEHNDTTTKYKPLLDTDKDDAHSAAGDSDASSCVPSVFSHGSSHGAIEACGVPHMMMRACKADTTRYLARYGDALRHARTHAAAAAAAVDDDGLHASPSSSTSRVRARNFAGMTLPQLTHWLVNVQRPLRPAAV